MARSRYHRGMKKAPKRSRALTLVLERLEQMERSVAWLGRQLSLSRQTVHGWRDLPYDRVEAIAAIVGLHPDTLYELRMPQTPQKRAA